MEVLSRVKHRLASPSALLLVLCIGCATSRRASEREWLDLFGSPPSSAQATRAAPYSAERLGSDTRRFLALQAELEELAETLSTVQRVVLHREGEYISSAQNEAAELLMLRYTHARQALWELLRFYRDRDGADPATHYRGAILAMSAGLNLAYHSSRGIALFHDQPVVVAMMNSPHPRLGLPGGLYDELYDQVTSPKHLEALEVAWYLFCRELARPGSQLARIRETDPVYGPLVRDMDRLHADLRIQTDYILHVHSLFHSGLANRLHHSHIAAVGDRVAADVSAGLYSARGVLFRDVARIKRPGADLVQFSEEQVADVTAMMRPGDIVLTFTGGYMSNLFLPGSFKHGVTYIGSVEQRRELGLSDDFLVSRAVDPAQAEALKQCVVRSELPSGEAIDVIEAVAEGVIMNSLAKLMATHVNRMVVVRPALTDGERRDQLLALMQYVGAPYDFKFDFQDDRRQCCTELIYRTINDRGPLDIELVKLKGMWILAADDLLRCVLKDDGTFEVVVLADQDPAESKPLARLQTGSEARQALKELMAK